MRAAGRRGGPSRAGTTPAAGGPGGPGELTGTGAELLAAFPARPVAASWPATGATRKQVLGRLLVPPFALAHPLGRQSRRLGVVAVVNWLEAQPRWTRSAPGAAPP